MVPELSVLDPKVHGRLLADIDGFAEDARIATSHIHASLLDRVSDAEIEWIKHFRHHKRAGRAGLVVYGSGSPSSNASALAGFLVRNFVRARVMTNGQWLQAEQGLTDYTALLVPNFHVSKAKGGGLPDWKVGGLFDQLVARHVAGVLTVLYAESPKSLAAEYGAALWSFLDENFDAVQV